MPDYDQQQQPTGANEPAPPRVTALIVSYNSASALRRSIEALRASHGRDRFEILVVDLGSRDESPRIDSEFEDVTMLRLPKHFGATKAMNIATRTAMGDYILYLDPQVELAPDTLLKLMLRLDADEEASAVVPLLEDASTGKPVPQIYPLPSRETLAEACRTGAMPLSQARLDSSSPDGAVAVEYASRSAIMVRKVFVQGMNYFDERYGQYWADAELAFQIRKSGKKTLVLTGAKALWHTPGAVLTSKKLDADRWLGASAYLTKHEGFGTGFGFLLAAAFKALITFNFGLLVPLVSQQKIDGNQGPL
jgi:GT2 family glycosyltransferase